ncbi:hypothetical protein SNE40_013867 [Patella caerulea]|uniref:Uncharacterized protein n=1 Tax=Patella caerulea TaxID=87958 RepID=A0AAN8PRA9_PATCE
MKASSYLVIHVAEFVCLISVLSQSFPAVTSNSHNRLEDSVQTQQVLCATVKTLRWEEIVVFYDSSYQLEMIQTALDTCYQYEVKSGVKTVIFDVSNFTSQEMRARLISLYLQMSLGIRAILMLESYNLKLLGDINEVDYASKRTTNYQSNSQWILIGDQEMGNSLVKFEYKLNNVLIMCSCCGEKQSVYTVVQGTATKPRCLCNANVTLVASVESCTTGDLYPSIRYKLGKRHLLIGTIESSTYFDIRLDENNRTVYSGLVVELTEMLAQSLNFTFTFVEPADCNWGFKINGVWTGMVGQLLQQEVDIVVADLTATPERQEVVDFIFPAYLVQTMGILYHRGERLDTTWSKVFGPLHTYVYCCILASIIVLGVMIVVFDRLPTTNETSIRSINIAYISNVIFSLIGFILLRDNKFWPKKESIRVLVAFFWLFCAVISATYVGNLTAKLAEIKETKPFHNIKELAALEDWKWGSSDELVMDILRTHTSPEMKALWEGIVKFNKSDPSVLLLDHEYHMNRLRRKDENYAYIAVDAKYFAYNQKDCVFELLDRLVSSLSLAIAVNKNSYLKRDLQRVMLELSKTGLLEKLEETHYADNRPKSCRQTVLNPLKIVYVTDMYGALLISGIGLAVSFVVLIGELFYIYTTKRVNRAAHNRN